MKLTILAALVALVVQLAGGLVAAITDPLAPTSTAAMTTARAGRDPTAKLIEFDRRPLSAYPQILARPVFFEGRKFPQPEDKSAAKPVLPAQPPPQLPPTTSSLKIFGVHLTASQRRVLLGATPAEASWYTEGEHVQDWVIEHIEQNQVKLSARGSVATVDLYSDQRPN